MPICLGLIVNIDLMVIQIWIALIIYNNVSLNVSIANKDCVDDAISLLLMIAIIVNSNMINFGIFVGYLYVPNANQVSH